MSYEWDDLESLSLDPRTFGESLVMEIVTGIALIAMPEGFIEDMKQRGEETPKAVTMFTIRATTGFGSKDEPVTLYLDNDLCRTLMFALVEHLHDVELAKGTCTCQGEHDHE